MRPRQPGRACMLPSWAPSRERTPKYSSWRVVVEKIIARGLVMLCDGDFGLMRKLSAIEPASTTVEVHVVVVVAWIAVPSPETGLKHRIMSSTCAWELLLVAMLELAAIMEYLELSLKTPIVVLNSPLHKHTSWKKAMSSMTFLAMLTM